MAKSIKWVVVEQQMMGRYAALRGLSFATQEDAQQHIVTKINEKYRYRYHVESRTVQDIDKSQTMHCQCCGRAIHAALGKIAHHGYTRPGYGWQTASCFGAKRLPWEADRSAVMDLINWLKETLVRSEYARCAVSDEIEPVTLWYYGPYDRNTCKSPYISIDITRATLDQLRTDVPLAFARLYGDDDTFEAMKAKDLADRDSKIKRLKLDIKEFTARYNGWTQTHKWEGKRWVAL